MIVNRFNPLGVRLGKPYAYEVEYLESDGSQYIDSGIEPSDDLELFCLFSDKAPTVSQFIYGSRNGNCTITCASGKFGIYAVGYARWGTSAFVSAVSYDSTEVCQSKASVRVDGEYFFYDMAQTVVGGYTIYLFAGNSNNNATGGFVGEISRFRITKNGEELLDFIPVVDYDGTPCMYDKATKQFFYNQGTGKFTAGPRI